MGFLIAWSISSRELQKKRRGVSRRKLFVLKRLRRRLRIIPNIVQWLIFFTFEEIACLPEGEWKGNETASHPPKIRNGDIEITSAGQISIHEVRFARNAV
jgi:hypothetical protein